MPSEPSRPAVVYALPDERQYFGSICDGLVIEESAGRTTIERPAGIPAPSGPVPYAMRIGVGIDHAFRNTSLLLTAGPPIGALIIVGFAGGLDSDLKPGHLVIAGRVVSTRDDVQQTPDAALLAAAASAVPGVTATRGLLATTDRVLCRTAEKRAFAERTGAVAVDMESAGAAAAAAQYGVPWIAVRVITDGLDDDLPFDFNAAVFQAESVRYGGVDRGAIIARIPLCPWKVPALVRLGLRSSRAARTLATFLRAYLPRVQP